MIVQKKQLMEYQEKMLEIAKNNGHFNKIKLNRFWSEENPKEIRNLLLSNDTIDDVLKAISHSHLYQINFSDSTQYYGIRHMINMFEYIFGSNELKKFIGLYGDGNCYPEDLTYKYSNRRVSLDFFRYLASALNIKKYIIDKEGKKINRIFELGAGLGGMARIMCLMFKPKAYYICDLPQSIIFSYMFLSKYLTGYKHILIENEKDLAKYLTDTHGKKIVYIPSVFAEKINNKEFDLFINTQSLGEMHNDTISFWFSFFQNVNSISYCYLLNRFMNIYVPGEMNEWRTLENSSSVLFDKKWNILHWSHEPFFLKCPFGFTAHARPLEIICKRTDSEVKIFDTESNAIDWFDNLDLFSSKFSMNNYLHKFSASNISADGTITSALYFAWEAARQFNDSFEINKRIILFLKLLRKEEKLVYEEEPFYWNRLKNIDNMKAESFLTSQINIHTPVQCEVKKNTLLGLFKRICKK